MGFNYYAYPWGRWIKWGIAALVAFILVISSVGSYNSLVALNEDVQGKWSQVENVMQARADKVNSLVEVVKGYVKHEEKVFGDVAAARSVLMNNSDDIKAKLDANDKLSNAAKSVLMLVENYPDLKADQQFHDLQIAIEGSNNRVSVERKRFIESVQKYNTKVTRFPGNIFAKLMGFEPKKYFEASPDAQNAPEVKF